MFVFNNAFHIIKVIKFADPQSTIKYFDMSIKKTKHKSLSSY